jgi:hypothetical protein
MRRTGNCFEDAAKRVIDFSADRADLILVHGLPLGTGGHAAGLRYPHGWVEWDDDGVTWVWDPCADKVLTAALYYRLGNIDPKVGKRYSKNETRAALVKYGTYGYWDNPELEAADEIINSLMEG